MQFIWKVKIGNQILTQSFVQLSGCRSKKHATTQAAPAMISFNRDIQNNFPFLNKTLNLSHQEKAKRNDINSKIKYNARYDKLINVKISDVKVGDKILIQQ